MASGKYWEVSSQRVELQSVTGKHEQGKSNDNVEELHIERMDSMFYLPVNIGKIFPNLKTLQATNNALKLVKKDMLLDFNKLVLLRLQENKITELVAEAFSALNELHYLRLTNNQISKVDPKSFKNLKKLKKLSIDGNQIEELPETVFDDLGNLVLLEMSRNKVKHLPKNLLKNLKKLEDFHAEYNQIKTIDVDFTMMTSVKQILLKGNVCVDDYFGFGTFNWILFGSQRYLTSLQSHVNQFCK